tara:strand:- start:904 stop:1065 length:162 start_codon:yes stop_codon:yes gene_type:complete
MADSKEDQGKQIVLMAAAQLSIILKARAEATPNDQQFGKEARAILHEFFEEQP